MDYFKEAAVYHDVVQGWLWLASLHREGAVVWRGQPGPGAPGVYKAPLNLKGVPLQL